MTCADQPAIRLTAKVGENCSRGSPTASSSTGVELDVRGERAIRLALAQDLGRGLLDGARQLEARAVQRTHRLFEHRRPRIAHPVHPVPIPMIRRPDASSPTSHASALPGAPIPSNMSSTGPARRRAAVP